MAETETVQERLRNAPVAFQRGVFGNVALLNEAADLIDLSIKERDEARAKAAKYERALADPVAVHANMLWAKIAKPSLTDFLHAMGNDALLAFRETIEIAARSEQSPFVDQARALLSGGAK